MTSANPPTHRPKASHTRSTLLRHPQHRAPGRQPQGPPAAHAVALRASLDPDALKTHVHNRRNSQKNAQPPPLTPTAPTGMTCYDTGSGGRI